MRRRHILRAALIVLAGIHGVILLAGFMAPYDFATQFRAHPFAPPAQLHFFDRRGVLHLRPFVYAQPGFSYSSSGTGDSDRIYPIHFFVSGAPYELSGIFTAERHLFGVSEPAQIFLLGTDEYGRDQFSRFLYGGQISLLSGLLGASFAVFFGLLIGAIAGFYGGWIDEALMRLRSYSWLVPGSTCSLRCAPRFPYTFRNGRFSHSWSWSWVL